MTVAARRVHQPTTERETSTGAETAGHHATSPAVQLAELRQRFYALLRSLPHSGQSRDGTGMKHRIGETLLQVVAHMEAIPEQIVPPPSRGRFWPALRQRMHRVRALLIRRWQARRIDHQRVAQRYEAASHRIATLVQSAEKGGTGGDAAEQLGIVQQRLVDPIALLRRQADQGQRGRRRRRFFPAKVLEGS